MADGIVHIIYCMSEADKNTVEIIRSSRRSISVEIRRDGTILVRAPRRMSREQIAAFLEQKRGWIEKHRRLMAERKKAAADIEKLSQAELDALAARAKKELGERTAHFAPMVGVTYGRITIRAQRTRWGSCSSKGNLNFNCLLMLAPPEVRDYVVVHELCHRKHMDHSPAFWAEVERVMPDWRERRRWLRDNGSQLLARLDNG